MEKTKRDSWSGQLGFIIAASASAVGLGNLWRFPSYAATYGGGIFLLTYLLLFLGFGVFLLITEIAIGRATRLSPIEAFRKLNQRWIFVGWLGTVIPFLIMPYYGVIGGWCLKYLGQYFFAGTAPDFDQAVGNAPEAVTMMLLFAAMTFAFIWFGVQKGVERSNKVMMPALLTLTVAMAVFVCCQSGARAGLKYYLVPDFSRLMVDGRFSPPLLGKMLLAGMGQMFFSLSIAMGIMITYGSYVPEETHMPKSAFQIGFCDTLVAFVAGIIIVPPVFAFGGEALAKTAGPGLMFVSLPQVFAQMPCTRLVAVAFFTLVLFAALTSNISLCETCVASLCDRTGINRRIGTVAVAVYAALAAIPSAVSLGFLDKVDYFANNILMPVCAFSTCIFIGWIVGPDFVRYEATKHGRHRMFGFGYYRVLIRYLAPLMFVAIFLSII